MAVGDLQKIEIRHKHIRHWLWYVTAISFVTGALLAACLRTQRAWRDTVGDPSMGWRVDALAERLRGARQDAQAKSDEIISLRAKLTEYESALAEGGRDKELINKELQQFKVLMGLAEMEGPGVTLTVDDSKFQAATTDPQLLEGLIVHDYDIQRVVNELRGAGAEAIAINGQRLVDRSAVRCVGPVMQVNSVPIGNPYVITAIGDPQVLKSGITLSGGILEFLRQLNFPVELKTLPKVTVPAFTGSVEMRHAKPVPPKDVAAGSGGEANG